MLGTTKILLTHIFYCYNTSRGLQCEKGYIIRTAVYVKTHEITCTYVFLSPSVVTSATDITDLNIVRSDLFNQIEIASQREQKLQQAMVTAETEMGQLEQRVRQAQELALAKISSLKAELEVSIAFSHRTRFTVYGAGNMLFVATRSAEHPIKEQASAIAGWTLTAWVYPHSIGPEVYLLSPRVHSIGPEVYLLSPGVHSIGGSLSHFLCRDKPFGPGS